MKWKLARITPVIIAASAIGFACLLEILPRWSAKFSLLERLEWITYDERVQLSQRWPRPVANNLGAVFLDEATVQTLASGNLGYQADWPYPRHVHGRLVRELAHQGAKLIAFDVLFGEERPFDAPILLPDDSLEESDDFFARQMREAGMVLIAAHIPEISKQDSVFPPELFSASARSVAIINAEPDRDGLLRRAKPFMDDPAIGRIWHMGIQIAAYELGLDLSQSEVFENKIILRGPTGVTRKIPLEKDGSFLIDWNLPWNDTANLTQLSYGVVVSLDALREIGPEEIPEYIEALQSEGKDISSDTPFRNKLVVVGSTMTGGNLTDKGPTPLEKETFLVSKYWNIANSIITDQFIIRSPVSINLLLIVLLGALAAGITWKERVLNASLLVMGIILAYTAFALFVFVQHRYWIPLVLPIAGALFLTHVVMVTWRVRMEQNEKRRVKAVFARIVSPNVVNELLQAEKLSLGGARRQITVYFADVRGFTEMTDTTQARAEEHVRTHGLTGDAAEAYYDQQARENLATVNLYLSTIADMVKKHNGTLDKYMGDCVMAFWGAPTANPQHALHCVRSAVESQCALYALNQKRAAENKRREEENIARAAAGEPLLPNLPLLSLGSGINTGIAVVGLMGSDAHILNYTVFGGTVNVASRLEGVSGRGRIIIGGGTHRDLQRDDPQLAATCVELPPVTVKGIREPVKIYEVPWRQFVKPATPEPARPAAEATPAPAA